MDDTTLLQIFIVFWFLPYAVHCFTVMYTVIIYPQW